ncbi:hypothetical protein LZ32DRAFT_445544 [Colletotrichum eremochloae]|nr:hypothetical protein LZ32DRAFT_445544 [Colletotrichum eremochloae]
MACMSSSSATKSRLPRKRESLALEALSISFLPLWRSQVALSRSIAMRWTRWSLSPGSRLHAVGATPIRRIDDTEYLTRWVATHNPSFRECRPSGAGRPTPRDCRKCFDPPVSKALAPEFSTSHGLRPSKKCASSCAVFRARCEA